MKNILLSVVLLGGTAFAKAQSLSHQVINTAGGDHQVGDFWVTDNVGESFVETFAPTGLLLTGGFLQPEITTMEIAGLTIYNGVTPNNDGRNDKWVIEGITEYPDNTVMLFNRWGRKVFEVKGYDNETKFWPANEDLSNLQATTYFYIITLTNDSKPIKGWVELIKN